MSNRSKRLGTEVETAVKNFLESKGWIVHRQPPGIHDLEAVSQIGGHYAIECKGRVRDGYDIPAWIRQARKQRDRNAPDAWPVVVVKPQGIGTANQRAFWVIQELDDWARTAI